MALEALQIDMIFKIIMNTILVSIPEELYFVLFTYIMMGEFDQWKDEDCKRLFQPWDYPRVLIPAVAAAVISNVLRYTGVNPGINPFVVTFTLFAGIVAMGDILNNAGAIKWMGKALVFLLLGALILCLCEFSYVPFLLYSSGKTIYEINNNIVLNFLVSIPSRIVEYSLLAFLVVHKRTLLKARIFKIVFESRLLTVFFLVTLLADLCFVLFLSFVVGYEKSLAALPVGLSMAVILGICIFPILNLSALVWCTYYAVNRDALIKRDASNRINGIIEDINRYSEKEDFENVKWTLNGLTTNLKVIADNLYIEERRKQKSIPVMRENEL